MKSELRPILLVPLALFALLLGGDSPRAKPEVKKVLVELYTSQG